MKGDNLLTSFMHYCSSKIKQDAERIAPEIPAAPRVCSECPYGRTRPCSAARRAQCIYASGSTTNN